MIVHALCKYFGYLFYKHWDWCRNRPNVDSEKPILVSQSPTPFRSNFKRKIYCLHPSQPNSLPISISTVPWSSACQYSSTTIPLSRLCSQCKRPSSGKTARCSIRPPQQQSLTKSSKSPTNFPISANTKQKWIFRRVDLNSIWWMELRGYCKIWIFTVSLLRKLWVILEATITTTPCSRSSHELHRRCRSGSNSRCSFFDVTFKDCIYFYSVAF